MSTESMAERTEGERGLDPPRGASPLACGSSTPITPRSTKTRFQLLLTAACMLLWLNCSDPRGAVAGEFSGLQWANRAIHLEGAWQIVPGRGAGITVCDVDSGVMLSHPDLKDAIVGGTNTANAAAPEQYADDAGHGTYTAGIILARGKDIWGVAPGAALLVAKVLNKGEGDASTVTAGILWCINQGARVINLSLAVGSKHWDGFQEAVQFGCRRGVDFAVAAGNDSWSNEQINPANVNSPCLITVNASDRQGKLAQFSNYRENTRTVTAPGQVIVSDWTNGSVTLGSGTSASAPLVAGVMALLRSQGADAQTAVKVILGSAHHPQHIPLVDPRRDHLGAGILDAAAACRMYRTVRLRSLRRDHYAP